MNHEKESVVIAAKKYESLERLTEQEGWKVLLDHLGEVKTVVMEALLLEKDFNKLMVLQERYRAFNSVIQTLQSAKAIKEKLHQDIQNIIEDENNIREFGI